MYKNSELEVGEGVERTTKCEALVIIYYSTFGNAACQLANALQFGSTRGIERIYCPEYFSTFAKEGEVRGMKVLIGRTCQEEAIKDNFWGAYSGRLSDLTPLLIFNYKCEAAKDSTLHIHFRGGNIFRENPHKGYAQPPACYYRKILLEEPWEKIVIVSEDFRNPCLLKTIEFITELGLPYRVQSSSFLEDINELYSAKNIVCAYGTFVRPIVETSLNLRRVYCFRHGLTNRVGVKVRVYTCPEYLPVWENTESQRTEMLEYPESKLQIYQ